MELDRLNADERQLVSARIRNLMLDEAKTEKLDWYYISVADEKFRGGYLIKAQGPTVAWRFLHAFGWWVDGCSTSTNGPISDEVMAKIPDDMRWRKLTKDEALNLGK